MERKSVLINFQTQFLESLSYGEHINYEIISLFERNVEGVCAHACVYVYRGSRIIFLHFHFDVKMTRVKHSPISN